MADSNPESNAAIINVPIELLMGQSKSDAGSLLDYKQSDHVTEDGRNSSAVVCGSCKCTIMNKGTGKLVEKEMFLPSMTEKYRIGQEPLGDTCTSHWIVKDMFHFENIGFCKKVDSLQYLICADCEIGPIGWHDTTNPKEFYLTCERVKYASD